MRLPLKLALLLGATTAMPLLLATAFAVPQTREALRSQLNQIYAQDARALATEVNRTLVDKLDALTLAASTLGLGTLDPEARQQALLVIYRETRGADVVGLFDTHADAQGSTIHFDKLAGEMASEHETVNESALSVYAGKVPLAGALQTGLAVGPIYVLPDAAGKPIPRLVLAVAVSAPAKQRWVLAVEVSLRRIAESFERFRPGERGAAFLLDRDGKIIWHPNEELVRAQARLGDAQSPETMGADAAVPLLGWKVVVQEPIDEALRPLRHLQRQSQLWLALGILLAVLIGFVAVRTVTAPVQRLREAALAVTGGALETHVEVNGHDELSELSDAFNAMVLGLREREGLKLTLSLSETLELNAVLERLLDSLKRAVGFDESSALIRTRDNMDLIVSRGPRGHAEAARIIPTSAHVAKAVSSLQPSLSEGRQMLALPLVQRGVVIGVVCLERAQAYTEAQARLAFSLTQPAALAVENARLFDEVQRLATLDGLTNTYNRRHFMDLSQRAFDSARRFGQPLSAVMLDVDHFKSINDRYGHAVGDQVLRGLADRIRSQLRSIDVLGRYGGEEFAIILPGTRGSGSAVLADRIRLKISDDPIVTDAGPVTVTVSVGVAGMEPGTPDTADLLKRADASLYLAKQSGRNRVVEDQKPVASSDGTST